MVLWIIAVILAAMSVLVVYSSTGVEALNPGNSGNHWGVLVRQLVIVGMGLGVIYGVHKINYQFYGRVVWVAYALALALTILVYFVGEVNPDAPDAPRWIKLPIINMTFQPSDFLKVATVMVVARELARRQKSIAGETILPLRALFGADKKQVRILREETLPLLGPIVLSCGTILPANLSTALILFGTCFVMLFIGRVRLGDLGKLMMIGLLAVTLIIGAAMAAKALRGDDGMIGRSGTWKARIEQFFSGEKQYQVEQAEIAIAVGGLTGRGAGGSTQRGILPLAESDYAYAFVIEEYGSLIGGLTILLLYLWVFFRGIVIFRKCGTAFPSLLVLGLALLITTQAMINMMVSTNMIPSTGIALPLISKGGSSELFLSSALGMMLGVSRQTQEKTLDTPKAETMLE